MERRVSGIRAMQHKTAKSVVSFLLVCDLDLPALWGVVGHDESNNYFMILVHIGLRGS